MGLFSKKDWQTVKFAVSGMSCGHCTKRVQDALEASGAVKNVSVQLDDGGFVEVTYDAGKIDLAALKALVTEAGYTPA